MRGIRAARIGRTRVAEKAPGLLSPQPFCHSERSEESLLLFMSRNRREIPRSARNDKIKYFFSSQGLPENLSRRGKIKSSWTGNSMVEQLTLNQRVVGSSPTRFTIS